MTSSRGSPLLLAGEPRDSGRLLGGRDGVIGGRQLLQHARADGPLAGGRPAATTQGLLGGNVQQ